MPVPVILDCDPGVDDALAIVLAAADPAIDLLAITTVAGNVGLDKTTRNARRVCDLAGITGVPVAAGCDRPLAQDPHISDHTHGESGLGPLTVGEPETPLAGEHAVDLIHRLLGESETPVTIIAVGPLTNIATLFRRYPGDRSRVARVVIMGGSTERGNAMPYAEFNTYADPEAADEVLRSGVPTVWHGLNVTYQALATPDIIESIAALGTPLADACVQLMTYYAESYRTVWRVPHPPVHDAVAVAYVIDESLIECAHTALRVELRGEHTRGATVADLLGRTDWEPNAHVGVTLDAARFWPLLVSAIRTLGA
ncbi:nucleoside hydrolase [Bailinhaonella thermotolerans]|uniref:Nucleoside hydrolase n=1 Tax=Bailinhaonella thermotolerans TaxID=1070861 RepID=A0A3A4AET5_9ACTN|nr:nucleoside hydrolase [Bailinhaonella thermotolerans]RJL24540.1 nucleoside hydrolase [Bailinhaonella thermotolerans]